MEAAGDEETPLLHHHPPSGLYQNGDSRLNTCDATVDVNGQPAAKASTGNWRACFFILGIEFSECLAFFAISKNLVTYLTSVLHESNVDAARNVSTWIGTTFFTPLVGAFLADTYWGRYKTIVIFLSIYTIGMLVLTVSAMLPSLMQSSNHGGIHRVAVYTGLYLTALGNGGIKPCTSAFGADQFDMADPVERVKKGSFFNCYFFAINVGSLLSTTVIVWVQDNVGWGIGFAVPMILMSLGFAVFVTGRRVYRYKTLGESPMTRVSRVIVAAARNCHMELPDDCSALHHLPSPPIEATLKVHHTTQFRFLDKAAILPTPTPGKKAVEAGPWRLCTMPQVEEVKMLLRLCPAWVSMVVFFMITAQMSSTLIEQGMAMDNHVGPFTVPPASLAGFDVVAMLVLIPIYDAVLVPFARRATGLDRGLSHPQRLGVGLALSMLAMAYSALLERNRLAVAATGATYKHAPAWVSMVVFFMITAQMSSTLIEQGMAMDNHVGPFTVPPASLAGFDVVAMLVLIPIYDAVLVPFARRATGLDRGLSHPQRLGVGLALSMLAMAYSALLERNRLAVAATGATVSIMWQAPAYTILGAGEVFAAIGVIELFYDQAPDGMRSMCTALAQLAVAAGNYLNSAVLGSVASATGWIPEDLDDGHLDYFFWLMAVLGALNLLQFLLCSIPAMRHTRR
uniref:Peptide transporter PTR2 n=1 Tax=Aegilops tauschii TaxID=37682 RepID=M8B946_AEGTA